MQSTTHLSTLKQQVDIERVLDHYGLMTQMRRTANGGLRGYCPFHRDAKPSFTTTPTKRGFHCFGCGVKGNVLTFVRLKEQIDSGNVHRDDSEAARLLQSWFGIDTTAKHQTPAPPPNPPLAFTLEPLDQKHPDLISRGLSTATIKHFGLGLVANQGILSGRIVLPIHDTQGQLVAYAAQWPGEAPPKGQPTWTYTLGFHPSLELFNLHRVPPHVRRVVVVMDYWSVFHLHQMGFRHVVALMDTSLSEQQRRLLCTRFQRVQVFAGGNERDKKTGLAVAMQLVPDLWVRLIDCPTEDQPHTLTPEQLSNWLR